MSRQGESQRQRLAIYLRKEKHWSRMYPSWIFIFDRGTRVRLFAAPRAWSSRLFYFYFQVKLECWYFDRCARIGIRCRSREHVNFGIMTREGSNCSKEWNFNICVQTFTVNFAIATQNGRSTVDILVLSLQIAPNVGPTFPRLNPKIS